jgi:putative membrane protein
MKNNPTALQCAFLVSALSLSSVMLAETSTSTTTATHDRTASSTVAANSKLSHSDRSFFEKAAKSGVKEVTISQAVADRLVNPQIKQFAQMMVSDHSNANSELMALAASKGVVLPAKDTKEMKFEEKWSKKSKGVDEDYMEEMVSDHKDAVDLFEKAAKSEDPDIAAFARKTLPTLQQHLTMAKDLHKMSK